MNDRPLLRKLGKAPKITRECPHPDCTRRLRSDNTTGWCWKHKRDKGKPERELCTTPECDTLLNRNNTTGYCTPCQRRRYREAHREEIKEYGRQRRQREREAFLERYRELELRTAHKPKRMESPGVAEDSEEDAQADSDRA